MGPDEDTFADRFLSHAIRLFLEGCTAKNKVVRMRVLQCITEIIANLKSLEYVCASHPAPRCATLTTRQRRPLRFSPIGPPGAVTR